MNSPVSDWSETIQTAKIHGYDVELVIENNGGDVTSTATVSHGHWYASFEYLDGTGCLYHEDADHIVRPLASQTVEAIRAWLLDNGY